MGLFVSLEMWEPILGTGVALSNRCQWKFGATFKSMTVALGSRQRVRTFTATQSAVQKSGCKKRSVAVVEVDGCYASGGLGDCSQMLETLR